MTILRAPWTDFKFPKTAYTYVSRFFWSKDNWGSRCYWTATIYIPKRSIIALFYCQYFLTNAVMHRGFIRSDRYFSFQIKWKHLLAFLEGFRCYLDRDSVRIWTHYWFPAWSLWRWVQPLPLSGVGRYQPGAKKSHYLKELLECARGAGPAKPRVIWQYN